MPPIHGSVCVYVRNLVMSFKMSKFTLSKSALYIKMSLTKNVVFTKSRCLLKVHFTIKVPFAPTDLFHYPVSPISS